MFASINAGVAEQLRTFPRLFENCNVSSGLQSSVHSSLELFTLSIPFYEVKKVLVDGFKSREGAPLNFDVR